MKLFKIIVLVGVISTIVAVYHNEPNELTRTESTKLSKKEIATLLEKGKFSSQEISDIQDTVQVVLGSQKKPMEKYVTPENVSYFYNLTIKSEKCSKLIDNTLTLVNKSSDGSVIRSNFISAYLEIMTNIANKIVKNGDACYNSAILSQKTKLHKDFGI